MKLYNVVTILLLSTHGYHVSLAKNAAAEKSIRDIIDEFLDAIKNQIPEKVELPGLSVSSPESDYVKASVNITQGYVAGLRDFDVQVQYRGIIIPIPTGFIINLYNINLHEDVLFKLRILSHLLPFAYRNKVDFNALTLNFVIKGDLDFSLIPLNVSVSALEFNIGEIQFNIDGILTPRFSALLSKVLTENVANLINGIQEPISSVLVDIINNLIRSIFEQMYIADSEKVLTSASQEKSLEKLTQFFEILKMMLNLYD